MGRIKTQLVKRLSRQLLREYPTELAKTFDENKPIVASLLTQSSKKIRNVVAGYVTRLVKERDERQAKEQQATARIAAAAKASA